MIKEAVDLGFEVGMFQHRKELEMFLAWLTARGPLSNVMEIGTLHGGTAAMWSKLATGTIVTIDLPNGRFGGADHYLDEAACELRAKRLKDISPRIESVIGDSKDDATRFFAGTVCDQSVDLLFIDGDHTVDGVTSDYLRYQRFVKPGGVIAFHDINDTAFHREAGCLVHDFWKSLIVAEDKRYEFTINAEWGGIGAVIV